MRDGLPVVKSRGLCLMPRHEMGKYGQMILENGNVKSPYICLDDYYVFTLVNVEIVPENVVKTNLNIYRNQVCFSFPDTCLGMMIPALISQLAIFHRSLQSHGLINFDHLRCNHP